jgi:hypothetical protein
MIGSCGLFTQLQLYEMLLAELPGSGPCWRRPVLPVTVRTQSDHLPQRRFPRRPMESPGAIVTGSLWLREAALSSNLLVIKRALRTGHAMRARIDKIIRAVTLPEIVELPRLVNGTTIPHQLLNPSHS